MTVAANVIVADVPAAGSAQLAFVAVIKMLGHGGGTVTLHNASAKDPLPERLHWDVPSWFVGSPADGGNLATTEIEYVPT